MKKVIEGRITSSFGNRTHPITRETSLHNGIDIAAPVGTDVLSPATCKVMSISTHRTGGLTLILGDIENSVRYGFCHLDSIEVAEGDIVKAGDVVAKSGNTGRSTGPHLHYSVKTAGKWHGATYTGGRYIDPVPYLEICE